MAPSWRAMSLTSFSSYAHWSLIWSFMRWMDHMVEKIKNRTDDIASNPFPFLYIRIRRMLVQ